MLLRPVVVLLFSVFQARLLARQRRLDDEQRRLDSFRNSYVTHTNGRRDEVEKLKERLARANKENEMYKSQQDGALDSWLAQHAQVVATRKRAAAWLVWRRQFLDEMNTRRLLVK